MRPGVLAEFEHHVDAGADGVLARRHRGVHLRFRTRRRHRHHRHRHRRVEAAAVADADDPPHPQAQRFRVHLGARLRLAERGAARFVLHRVGLVDFETRAVDLVGAAGDQRIEHLAELGQLAHLEVHGIAGLVAGDRRRLVLGVLVVRVEVDAAGLDVLVGDAGAADRGHHLLHLLGVGAHRRIGVRGLGDDAGGEGGDIRGVLDLGRCGHRQQGAVGSNGVAGGGLGLGAGGHGRSEGDEGGEQQRAQYKAGHGVLRRGSGQGVRNGVNAR